MMKIRLLPAMAAVSAAAALLVTGCGGADQYGQEMSQADPVAISEILGRPADFEGKTVKVEGEIVTECPSGCWFDMGEGGATIHVDLGPHGIAIPQRVGSSATVEGTFRIGDGRAEIIGSGVELR